MSNDREIPISESLYISDIAASREKVLPNTLAWEVRCINSRRGITSLEKAYYGGEVRAIEIMIQDSWAGAL